MRGRFVLIPNSLNHRRPGLTLKWAAGSTQFPGHPWVLLTYLAQLTKRTGGGGMEPLCLLSPFNLLLPRKSRQSDNTVRFQAFLEGGQPL